jgi:predicted glycoside hydrolase/deacetylase ChbG (UPF0249 family)
MASPANAQEKAKEQATGEIRLLIRADDIGSSHAANEACIKVYRDGIARSVEVMVPCPWFIEAAAMLNENPGYDVGVHLTLTAEWQNCKWRPLTHCPSLVDPDGYFFPMTWRNEKLPPNTSFLEAPYKLDEVEREIRAQILMAQKHIKNVTHISSHMGTSGCTPELKALSHRVAQECGLATEDLPNPTWLHGFEGAKTPAERPATLADCLSRVGPGFYVFVDHPGMDVAEMRALGHAGYWNVAQERQAVTDAFTDPKVLQVIKDRKIQLVSYAQMQKPAK